MLVNDGGVIDSMGRILCISVLLDAAAVAAVTVTIVVANVAVTVAAAAVLAVAVAAADVATPRGSWRTRLEYLLMCWIVP